VIRAAGIVLVLVVAVSCDAGVLQVGSGDAIPFDFGTPVLVAELASSPSRSENPTLTVDGLEIYFTSNRNGGTAGDVWFAERSSVDEPFGTPAPVAGVNSDSFETSSAISGDGLTLWFGSERAGGSGGVDIWVSQRPSRSAGWSDPTSLAPLNSPADDIPRPPGQHALVMPLASTVATTSNPTGKNYQTYLATRATTSASFDPPTSIPELDYPDRSTVDAFLTEDGLTMFFSSTPVQGSSASDLYVAFRRSIGEPFTVTLPLAALNTTHDERDPWLSADGTILYFTSDREADTLNIFSVPVRPR
jgi:WD40-like Beta Propeller Repeat